MKNQTSLMRSGVRRVVPFRVRRAAKLLIGAASGRYLREMLEHMRSTGERANAHQETLDQMLRRMRRLEEEVRVAARSAQRVSKSKETDPLNVVPSNNLAAGDWGAPRVGVVCNSLGRRCGISEYATRLSERLDGTLVENAADLALDIDTVFVQYEPSLYPEISDILREIQSVSAAATVVVDAHDISEMVVDELRWHAIVATKRGLYPGAIRLSHLQQAPVPTELEPASEIRLGAFGFAFPAKRYEKIIALARKLEIPATILAAHGNATPWHADLSSSYIAHLKTLAGDGVEIIDNFLPQQEVIERLRQCSHIVSCMDDNGAQSGSLRIAAAAGRPLISVRTEQAREVGAILVDDVESLTLDFLKSCTTLPQTYDGIADYHSLIEDLARFRGQSGARYSDDYYLDDPAQMERLAWLRDTIGSSRALSIGYGGGFAANQMRAEACVLVNSETASPRLRYPHIEFHHLDPRLQILEGFQTVVFHDLLEHMSYLDARQLVAFWAETAPERILATLPGGANGSTGGHGWQRSDEAMQGLAPASFEPRISSTSQGEFLLVEMRNTGGSSRG